MNFSIKLMYFLSFSRWFCHFDDDNYVNVPRLVKLLDEYSPTVDWYLGKPSISSPLEIHLDSVSAMHSYKLRSFLVSFRLFAYFFNTLWVITRVRSIGLSLLQGADRLSPLAQNCLHYLCARPRQAICLCRHLASSCQRRLSLITDMIWRTDTGYALAPNLYCSLNPFPFPFRHRAKAFEISPADPVMNVHATVLSA